MLFDEKITLFTDFIGKLGDQKSRELLEMRVNYSIYRDEDILEEQVYHYLKKCDCEFNCGVLEGFYESFPDKKNAGIIVFGAGRMGKRTVRSLKLLKKKVLGIVDNSRQMWGQEMEGIIINSPEEIQKNPNAIIIIATSQQYQLSIYYQIKDMGINMSNVLMWKYEGLWCDAGTQYFDLEELKVSNDKEVFLDVGCFDACSSFQAKNWAGNSLKKIYAFEADGKNYVQCEKYLTELGVDFELFNVAAWDEKCELRFDERDLYSASSRISEEGNVVVHADKIDNLIEGKEISFLKMDIEGAELNALKGAVNSIRKHRPKLAISIYHKPEDIFEIPVFLEGLDINYKYYIRHYSSCLDETILYAIPV